MPKCAAKLKAQMLQCHVLCTDISVRVFAPINHDPNFSRHDSHKRDTPSSRFLEVPGNLSGRDDKKEKAGLSRDLLRF